MALKAVFIVFAVLSLVKLSLANPDLCPSPENAVNLAHKEEVHIEAPSFGRAEKTVIVPLRDMERSITCVTLTGLASAGPSGSVSIASMGLSEGNFAIKLVSQIKLGIDAEVAVYTN